MERETSDEGLFSASPSPTQLEDIDMVSYQTRQLDSRRLLFFFLSMLSPYHSGLKTATTPHSLTNSLLTLWWTWISNNGAQN